MLGTDPAIFALELLILEGLGHVAAFTRSDLVLPHVQAFLNDVLR
jgi:hypothetical protein